MMPYPNRPTWLEINQDALRNNTQKLCAIIGPDCQLMAVIKANAYGHGAADVARIVLDAGAHYLAVASLSEAVELRNQSIQAPILVLGYTPPWLAEEAIAHNVTLTVYDLALPQALSAACKVKASAIPVHVKVNTGMNRLGLVPDQVNDFVALLHTLSGLVIEGIFTHFSTSDLADKTYTYEQLARFNQVIHELRQRKICPPLAHAANSAAILTVPESYQHFQMARSGIALYGMHPDADDTRLPAEFQPGLQWKAMVAQVQTLSAGDSVSYGREFIAPYEMSVAVIPVGYADGFPRKPHHWGSVLIHGQHAPIVGRVCMDQTVVDVTHIDVSVQQGDEVVLIGRQGTTQIWAEEIGERLGTINYDVTSRILARVPRILF